VRRRTSLLMDMVPDLIQSLAIAQVARGTGSAGLQAIKRGIDVVEATIQYIESLDKGSALAAAKTPHARVKLLNQGINAMREQLSVVKRNHGIVNASSSEQAKYIINLGDMKHTKGIINRAHTDESPEERARHIVRTVSNIIKSCPPTLYEVDVRSVSWASNRPCRLPCRV
jgi:type III secretion system FlhB-like substrate exporter